MTPIPVAMVACQATHRQTPQPAPHSTCRSARPERNAARQVELTGRVRRRGRSSLSIASRLLPECMSAERSTDMAQDCKRKTQGANLNIQAVVRGFMICQPVLRPLSFVRRIRPCNAGWVCRLGGAGRRCFRQNTAFEPRLSGRHAPWPTRRLLPV